MQGHFSGEPRTEWLTEPGPDRRMVLLEPMSYTDPAGRVWPAPKGSVVDGASIPRALWTLVGSPYTGDYRRASIVHDVATDPAGPNVDRRAADRMFFHACLTGGCPLREAILLYIGVRIGAHEGHVAAWRAAAGESLRGPRLRRTPAEEQLEADYRQASETVLAHGETDDVRELERRTDAALSEAAGVDLRAR